MSGESKEETQARHDKWWVEHRQETFLNHGITLRDVTGVAVYHALKYGEQQGRLLAAQELCEVFKELGPPVAVMVKNNSGVEHSDWLMHSDPNTPWDDCTECEVERIWLDGDGNPLCEMVPVMTQKELEALENATWDG